MGTLKPSSDEGGLLSHDPWSSSYVSLHVAPWNSPNLYLCSVLYVFSGGFTDATTVMCWFGVCWGHDTDVSWTGCERLGSETRRSSFYVSLVGGGLRLSGPGSGRRNPVTFVFFALLVSLILRGQWG